MRQYGQVKCEGECGLDALWISVCGLSRAQSELIPYIDFDLEAWPAMRPMLRTRCFWYGQTPHLLVTSDATAGIEWWKGAHRIFVKLVMGLVDRDGQSVTLIALSSTHERYVEAISCYDHKAQCNPICICSKVNSQC